MLITMFISLMCIKSRIWKVSFWAVSTFVVSCSLCIFASSYLYALHAHWSKLSSWLILKWLLILRILYWVLTFIIFPHILCIISFLLSSISLVIYIILIVISLITLSIDINLIIALKKSSLHNLNFCLLLLLSKFWGRIRLIGV